MHRSGRAGGRAANPRSTHGLGRRVSPPNPGPHTVEPCCWNFNSAGIPVGRMRILQSMQPMRSVVEVQGRWQAHCLRTKVLRNRSLSRSRSHLAGYQLHQPSEPTSSEGPFGEVIRASGSMAKGNPLLFSTKYQDDESGLRFYGYRYCSSSVGRWLSRDPLQERGGLALYCFVNNASISSIDLLGLRLGVSECQGHVRKLLAEDDTGVAILMKQIRDHKCRNPFPRCAECPSCFGRANGYTAKGAGFVILCANNQDSIATVKETLIHELVHSLDYCIAGYPDDESCEFRICSEIKAYKADGSCSQFTGQSYRTCIANAVLRSISGTCLSWTQSRIIRLMTTKCWRGGNLMD